MCGKKTEVFSRVVGYHRPITNWNKGKQEEFKDRHPYTIKKVMQGIASKQILNEKK
jgi:hypothetical protein